jgi:sugar/nucleoside kinase (ribokinase family)
MTDPAAGAAAADPATDAATDAASAPVVVFGDVIDDLIVTPAGEIRPDTDTTARIERRAGGSAANAAAWFAAASAGRPVHFFGHVHGSDVERHGDELRAAGVIAHLRGEPDLPTGTIVVILQPDRTRTMLTERGANARTAPRDVDTALLVSGGHLHFTGYSVFADPGAASVAAFAALVGEARRAGASVSVNPGSAGFLADHGVDALLAATEGVHLLITNLDEGRMLAGTHSPEAVLSALLESYEIVALTLGRDGVLAGSRGAHGPHGTDGAHPTVRVPAVPVTPVDTTGAGDAFSAGFASRLLAAGAIGAERMTPALLADSCRAGVELASRAVTQLGARPEPAPRMGR